MQIENIKRLSGDAARLLLVFHMHEEGVGILDIPDVVAAAGLAFSESNTHGKNRYGRAIRQLIDLHAIAVRDGRIDAL